MTTYTTDQLDSMGLDELLSIFGDAYIEIFNDIHGEVEVAGCTFPAAQVLQEMDPIAFEQGFLEYVDSFASEVLED